MDCLDLEDDITFMKLAEAEAETALRMGEVPVGCVFVRDGRVVARYFNCNAWQRLNCFIQVGVFGESENIVHACILVLAYNMEKICRGHNLTNAQLDATRHAEMVSFMSIRAGHHMRVTILQPNSSHTCPLIVRFLKSESDSACPRLRSTMC